MSEYTECHEIADNIAISLARRDLPEIMEQARAIVRQIMPDANPIILDNVAEALLNRGKHK